MKMVKIILVIVVLAGGSFALSYFLSRKPASAVASQAHATTKPSTPATAPSIEPPVPETLKEQNLDSLAKELKRRIDEYRRRTDELDQREQRLALAQESLKKRTEELETMQLKLMGPLNALKEAQVELQKTQMTVTQQENANLKRTALIYEKMDPAQSSKILVGMCGSSQDADAAKILYFMTDRAAAKVLSEISDKTIAANLTAKLKGIRSEPAQEKEEK